MQVVSELKKMHEQMVADLANLPQYRAMKAMERFLSEMGEIYNADSPHRVSDSEHIQKKIQAAIENRVASDLAQSPQPLGIFS